MIMSGGMVQKQKNLQQALIGIDWGTSRFRRMMIDGNGQILDSFESDQGLANISPEIAAEMIDQTIAEFPDLPILMAGMVGSTLGVQEVNYVDCPVSINQLSRSIEQYQDNAQVWIVPGVRMNETSHFDVMRGEEVQVFGWLSQQTEPDSSFRLCLPGTHSKWVDIQEGCIARLETVLTGELFDVLSRHSVLVQGEQIYSEEAFIKGVEAGSATKGLLRQLFNTRARVVAGNENPATARSYLSGLILGNELSEMSKDVEAIHFVCGREIGKHYQVAAEQLGLTYKVWDGSGMIANGLAQLWSLHNA